MKKYVISKTSNADFALAGTDLEAVETDEADACFEAEALTLETGNPHYVYEVDIKGVKGFRVTKGVEGFRFGPSI